MILKLILLVPLLALLLVAAAQDLRTRRIRNWLTALIVLTGLLQSWTPHHTVTPIQSLLGMAVGFGIPLLLFAIGALGGGDVKLLAGVGAWVGPVPVLTVFLAAAVVGMLIVVVQCAAQRKLPALLRNSAVLAANIAYARDLGIDGLTETGRGLRSIERPLPYAIPVLIATVLVVLASVNHG